MLAPRTVKILISLFLAMTAGTLVLTWLDVEPIPAPGMYLSGAAAADEAPLAVVNKTRRPFGVTKWQSIVIHSSAEGPAAVAKCHFLVEPAGTSDSLGIRANDYWLDQVPSAHVPTSPAAAPAPAIGVCLAGDFSKPGPAAEEQAQALVKLVTYLQRRFGVPKGAVYLYWTLSASRKGPGAAFPEQEFIRALLAIN